MFSSPTGEKCHQVEQMDSNKLLNLIFYLATSLSPKETIDKPPNTSKKEKTQGDFSKNTPIYLSREQYLQELSKIIENNSEIINSLGPTETQEIQNFPVDFMFLRLAITVFINKNDNPSLDNLVTKLEIINQQPPWSEPPLP